MCAPNNRAEKYGSKTYYGKKERHPVTARGFKDALGSRGPIRGKVSQDAGALCQQLAGSDGQLQNAPPTSAEHTLLPRSRGALSKTGHVVGHQTHPTDLEVKCGNGACSPITVKIKNINHEQKGNRKNVPTMSNSLKDQASKRTCENFKRLN